MTTENYTLFWGLNMVSAAVQVTMIELDTHFDMHQVNFGGGEHRNPDYLAINPVGKIPALRLPDGRVMTESAAMLIYLADLHPNSDLFPSPSAPGRPEALRWLLFLATELYPTSCQVYEPEAFADSEAGQRDVFETATARFDAQCALLEAELTEDYLLGPDAGLVDIYLTTILSWHPAPDRLRENCPKLHALTARIRARASVRQAFKMHEML